MGEATADGRAVDPGGLLVDSAEQGVASSVAYAPGGGSMRERASEVAGPTFGAGGLARDVPYGMSQLCDGVVRC